MSLPVKNHIMLFLDLSFWILRVLSRVSPGRHSRGFHVSICRTCAVLCVSDGSDDEGDDEQQSVFTQGLHSTIRLVNDFGSTLWNGPLDGDGSGKFLRCYGNDTMIKVSTIPLLNS